MGKEYHKNIPLFKEYIVNAVILWNILKDKTIAELKSKSSLTGKLKNNWLEY